MAGDLVRLPDDRGLRHAHREDGDLVLAMRGQVKIDAVAGSVGFPADEPLGFPVKFAITFQAFYVGVLYKLSTWRITPAGTYRSTLPDTSAYNSRRK